MYLTFKDKIKRPLSSDQVWKSIYQTAVWESFDPIGRRV